MVVIAMLEGISMMVEEESGMAEGYRRPWAGLWCIEKGRKGYLQAGDTVMVKSIDVADFMMVSSC